MDETASQPRAAGVKVALHAKDMLGGKWKALVY
jgi:hypothetical protein